MQKETVVLKFEKAKRIKWLFLPIRIFCFRAVHILTTIGESSDSSKQTEFIKALRAVRVLRPLKLVSGVPSK